MLEITLDKLPIGQEGIIQSVGGEGILRRRLLDMGLTPRTRVIVRKRAPLGDPLEIYIRRYELTLRASDASKITVIVEADARFVKAEKHMAAWRVISKQRCLVFPEAHWAKAYKQAARGAGNVDLSYFQKDGWELELQKTLCKNQLIKQPSSGFRYRYDLFGTGSRDKTYVVAIPAELLGF